MIYFNQSSATTIEEEVLDKKKCTCTTCKDAGRESIWMNLESEKTTESYYEPSMTGTHEDLSIISEIESMAGAPL